MGRTVDLDLSYVINEVEFHIEEILDGYDASDWLTFVRPFDQSLPAGVTIELGQPRVPVPVRGYPPLPSLLAQSAPPTQGHPANYAEALHWDYAFTYQHQSLAVDQLRLEVELNQAPLDLAAFQTGEARLFEALAQYDEVAPRGNGSAPRWPHWSTGTGRGASIRLTDRPPCWIAPLAAP